MPRSVLPILVRALTMLLVAAAPAVAQESRVAELERKVEVLTQEIENLKLGAVAETTSYAPRAGLGPGASKVYDARGVSIGGYGEMLYENFAREREDGTLAGRTDRLDFLRQVVYLGYKFTDALLFNSEIELEHAGVRDEAEVQVDVASGEGEAELSGEVVLEFAYVDLRPRPAFGLRAGMLLVPVGLVNEMHEPTVFAGARRPEVEQLIVPSTWRANGAGAYGELGAGLAYRAYVLEGLDASGFTAASAIRGGRQGGSQSLITKPALVARVDYSGVPGLMLGGSAYTCVSWQRAQPAGVRLAPRVTLVEAHAHLEWSGLETRALYARGTLDDAGELSDALGLTAEKRLGERFSGAYVEASYDLLRSLRPGSRYRFAPYARFETYDTQEKVPGGVDDPALERAVLTLGAGFQPHPNVVLKADHQQRTNEAETEANQWNLALGYVF